MPEPETATVRSDSDRVGSWPLLISAGAVAILYAVGLAALGVTPAATETGPELVNWFKDNSDGARLFVWSITVAAPLLAIMFALLRRFLPEPHRDVFLIGAVTYLSSSAVVTWIWGGLALEAAGMRPALMRALFDIAIFFGPVLTGSTTTMIAPVTWLALRGRAGLPRWLGVLGAIAFTEQAIETITIFGSTGFTQPGGAMNMQLGAGLTLAWLFGFAGWAGLRGRVANATA